MKIVGVILIIVGILFAMFWFDLIKKKEYKTDPSVFWTTLIFAALMLFLARLCFN